MAIYITQGCYTTQALKGLIAKPEDREQAVRQLVESAGGRMLSFYFTFGEYDWMMTQENDDPRAVAGALAAAAATGAISHVATTVALTTAEAMQAFERASQLAGSYRPAGG